MRRLLALCFVLAVTASPSPLMADTCSSCGVGSCGGAATSCMVEQTPQGSFCLYAQYADGSSFSQNGNKIEWVVVPCN